MTFTKVFCITFVVLFVIGTIVWAWQDGPVDDDDDQSGWGV